MPSRKKAKGKARKAAKAKEEESRAVVNVTADQRQEESLEARMQRLIINGTLCRHGCPLLSAAEEKICEKFISAYIASFHSEDDVGNPFATAYHATEEEYADVYDFKLDSVISMLLANGTQRILDGDKRRAQFYACLVGYFEDYIAVFLRKTGAMTNLTKLADLNDADDHTLVSFYRKRISCSCLDEKYKEVKSVKKVGLCFNPNCSQPGRKVERSKMFYCTRCGVANYCSVECQRADWKEHSSEECDKAVQIKAAFDSEQT